MEHRRHLRERFPHLLSTFNQQVSQVIITTLRKTSDDMTWKTWIHTFNSSSAFLFCCILRNSCCFSFCFFSLSSLNASAGSVGSTSVFSVSFSTLTEYTFFLATAAGLFVLIDFCVSLLDESSGFVEGAGGGSEVLISLSHFTVAGVVAMAAKAFCVSVCFLNASFFRKFRARTLEKIAKGASKSILNLLLSNLRPHESS